ncbi:hypothetical protein C8Q78DRAFT_995617 [Trametes maxima]|nr:hypothetical protein C8Q78DRAFT_995617 [Trametes maxima]
MASTLVPLLLAAHAHALPSVLSVFAPNDPVVVTVHPRPGKEIDSLEFWYKLAVAIALVLAGGVFTGLTLGLMGLDELHLCVLAAASDHPSLRPLTASKHSITSKLDAHTCFS